MSLDRYRTGRSIWGKGVFPNQLAGFLRRSPKILNSHRRATRSPLQVCHDKQAKPGTFLDSRKGIGIQFAEIRDSFLILF